MWRLMIFAFAAFAALPAQGAEYERLRVALHVDTAISHNTRVIKLAGVPVWRIRGDLPEPIETIVIKARLEGVDVIVVADRARAEIHFPLTRFSRLFKLTISTGSVADIGAGAFLQALERAQTDGFIIVPGLEAIPHYRLRGNLVSGLVFENLHRHMVLAGLDTSDKVDGIPDIASGRGWRFSSSILINVPLIALFVSGILINRRTKRKKLGLALTCIAALLLIDGAPFLPRGISASDDCTHAAIDAITTDARAKGAVSILAHPDTRCEQHAGPVTARTLPYPNLVRESDCTAFAAFNDGMSVLAAGGEWDAALMDFCRGQRAEPIWAVSECDYDAGSKPGALAEAQTIAFAKEKSAAGIVEALKSGRCYATRTDAYRKIDVVEYSLSAGAHSVASGETLAAQGQVTLNLRLKILSGTIAKAAERVRAQMIVNGVPTELQFETDGDEFVARADFDLPAQNLSYARVVVYDKIEPVIALNPIFIRRAGPLE